MSALSKNRLLIGLTTVASGALTAAGPFSLFKICSTEGHHAMATGAESAELVCHYTANAELGIGIVIALLGIAYLLFSNPNTHIGLSFGVGLSSVFSLLAVNVLIGVHSPPMSCAVKTLPALTLISTITIVLILGNIVYLLRKPDKRAVRNEA
jgi:hypothetical protein